MPGIKIPILKNSSITHHKKFIENTSENSLMTHIEIGRSELAHCRFIIIIIIITTITITITISITTTITISISKNHETLEPLSNSSIAQVLKNIENNYLKFWQGEITASKKLDFYRTFKQDFSVSSYIDILRNRGTRKSFVKFYLSNHKLCIESGRHRRPVLPREERIRAVCKNNEIEDEAHMLFSCTLYNTLREQFLIKQQHILNTAFDNYDYWLNILFTTENKASIRTTARYISQCFLLRDAASSN